MTPAWRGPVALAVLLSSFAAQAQAIHSSFDRAQHLRELLENQPESVRTRVAYGRVLDAYRAVYHANPASPKADASVLAVAQLLTEEGRLFSDRKLLNDAIGQYEFLRRQYPASRFRFAALIAQGEIYQRDLNDREAAKAKFQQFLETYPQNPSAEQVRIELNELRRQEHPPARHHAGAHNAVLTAALGSQQPRSAAPAPSVRRVESVVAPLPTAAPAQAFQANSPASDNLPAAPPNLHPGRVALVSGIRHWSTPVYTRIAIDLGDEVAYQAARVPAPDRIYFDLYGARLGAGLNGKSVEVIDDGFLRRIRAAQFSNDVTRIVLDVSSVSDYSAFLLPNPWRLIIDIHGLKAGAVPTTNLSTLPKTAPPSPSASSSRVSASSPAAASSVQEIASIGQQPNRVQATARPTTRPIAASVPGTTPAPQTRAPRPADDLPASTAAAPASTPSRRKPSPLRAASSPPPARLETQPETQSKTREAASDEDTSAPPPHAAEPTAAGERSLVRTLGLKIGRIVIDPGHGGHDSGTLGPGGIEEKDVVLDVALRVGKLLHQRLGATIIYTRANDTFIPLETRTAIANKAQADLFLSIHANSSPDPSARGVETYYLNFTTSPDALEVAARENAVSDQSIHELSDLVKKITLKDKIDESREFAADVQSSLYNALEEGNPGMRDRGVKKAPFVVLIGANMPSILAEISFLTNSADARELREPAYRQRIAEALYRGVANYVSGLSGVRLAQSMPRPTGN